jgi:predicted methyltransferase
MFLQRAVAVAWLGCSLSSCCGCREAAPPPAAPAPSLVSEPDAPSPAAAAAGPSTPATAADPAELAVAAADRSPDDRALDVGRRPLELLRAIGVQPGMQVAELGAGGGYTSELLARTVGPSGKVFAQNSPFILQRFAEKPWSERLAKPIMQNVVRVDREFGDPLPPEARDLDLVLMVLFYHDTVWQKVDRDAMNRAVFRALKPGGRYVIVDHSARPGSGLNHVETLHRIEQSVVEAELQRAGFTGLEHADFLRNPSDTRDWNASPRTAAERRGTSHRFVLMARKPAS